MRRSVYEQPGTRVDGSYCSKEGFQVSKGDQERKQKGISKGKAPMYANLNVYIMIVYKCRNDCQLYECK